MRLGKREDDKQRNHSGNAYESSDPKELFLTLPRTALVAFARAHIVLTSRFDVTRLVYLPAAKRLRGFRRCSF